MKLILFLFALTWSTNLIAYIPSSYLIIDKSIKSSGTGSYYYELEVQIPFEQETVSLKESWFVENENDMRVDVVGLKEYKDQIHFSIIYKNAFRYMLLENGQKQQHNLTQDNFERYFHFRNTSHLIDNLVNFKIVPAMINKRHPLYKKNQAAEYIEENFVHLTRYDGVITYALGTPTPVEAEKDYPGIWIEQDKFVIRKIRLPSGLTIDTSDYQPFANNLLFPRKRTLTSGSLNSLFLLKNLRVASLTEVQKALNTDTLKPSQVTCKNPKVKEMLFDFYQRYR